jgi:ABC-type nitrate/sulfonate/bicarbonate transport system substrate-binding protein
MQKAQGSHKSIVTALVLSILLWAVSSGAQEKAAPEKVRIAIATSSLAFMVPFVAKDRGFYLKHGSDVELIQMRPNISVAALLSGEIDYIDSFNRHQIAIFQHHRAAQIQNHQGS